MPFYKLARTVSLMLFVFLFFSFKKQIIAEPKGYAIILCIPKVDNNLLHKNKLLPDTLLFKDLPGTITDGDKIVAILKNEGFPEENIIRVGLTKKDKVKLADIQSAFLKISKKVSRNDLFVFYYSGHGHQIPDQPHGDEKDGLDEVIVANDGYLIDDNIKSIYQRYFSKTRNEMIMDACHAGSFYSLSEHLLRKANKIEFRYANYTIDCDISTETNTDIFNMIYYGASTDPNEGFDNGQGGYFTLALCNLYHPRYWQGISHTDLACRISSEMKAINDPGNGLIQYTESANLQDDFKNGYLFKIK